MVVYNEFNTFITNINFLIEISNFLKGCSEVYQVLIKQVEDMIIPHKLFLIVKQYLSRARINISSIYFTTNNYKKIFDNDLKVLKKFEAMEKIQNDQEQQPSKRKRKSFLPDLSSNKVAQNKIG